MHSLSLYLSHVLFFNLTVYKVPLFLSHSETTYVHTNMSNHLFFIYFDFIPHLTLVLFSLECVCIKNTKPQ